MRRALVEPEKCRSCQPCRAMARCEKKAIFRETPEEKPWVDFYRCAGCMQCKTFCTNGSILEVTQPCNGRGRMGW